MKKKIKRVIKPELNAITATLGKDFQYFRQRYFKHHREIPEAPFHKELTAIASKGTGHRNAKILIAASRGSGKSTIISEELVLFCVCNGLEKYILLVANTIGQVKDMVINVKDELVNNRLLAEDYPHVCETGEPPKPPKWTDVDVITRNGVRINGLSSLQQFRGKRFKEFRPSLIILDDIEADNHTLITPEKTDKLYFWLTRTIQNIGAERTNIFLLGTVHSYYSLLARFTEEDKHPEWSKHIYRAIISESKNPQTIEQWKRIYRSQDEHCNETGPVAANKFYEDHKVLFLEGSQTLWPIKFDYYALNIKREEIGQDSFNAEYQNSPSDPTEASFDMQEVRYIEDIYRSDAELIQAKKEQLRYYIGCDWSSGKRAFSGDYSAIIMIAKDIETNIMYILCADIARRRTNRIIDDILSYCKTWPIQKIAIETNQAQEILADLVQEKLQEFDLRSEIVRIVNNGDKKERIHNLQPLINTGRLCFSKRHHLLLEQLKNFPRGRYIDGLDALEIVIRVVGCKKEIDIKKQLEYLRKFNPDAPGNDPNEFFIQGGKLIENPFRILKAK